MSMEWINYIPLGSRMIIIDCGEYVVNRFGGVETKSLVHLISINIYHLYLHVITIELISHITHKSHWYLSMMVALSLHYVFALQLIERKNFNQ